jgi:organic radical activating enzyme
MFKKNCCDGIYNSFDIHFTSACDNNCAHCVDKIYQGINVKKPNVNAILSTIYANQSGYDDVLFLGGEPCLYLDELIECVEHIKENTTLKVYVTTSVPKTCSDDYHKFTYLLSLLDGMNLSVQHYKEDVADEIRKTKSKFDRQSFYLSLPEKSKIRINLNIVKPYLYTKEDILACLNHYDDMGFNEIKISEIQHGEEHFVSFEKIFKMDLKSPFYHGCQKHVQLPGITTPVLLKRSCFMCEETLKASLLDGIKAGYRIFSPVKNKYGVIYEDGSLKSKWI